MSVGEDWVLIPSSDAEFVLRNGFPPKTNIPRWWIVWEKEINWKQFEARITGEN